MQPDQKRNGPGVQEHVEAANRTHRVGHITTDSRPAAPTGSPIDTLLARLEGVQRSGNGYRAQCPACGGTSRKLSLCEGDNGAVVMTCFSCHDTPSVLGALGLSLADLYPQRITHATTPTERRELRQRAKESQWSAALDVLAREADVILIAAAYPTRGETLTDDDHHRLAVAIERIQSAKGVLNVR